MILSTYTDPALMKRVYRLEFDEAELIRLPFTPELWRQLQYSFDQGSVSGALFGLFLMASEWEKLMKVELRGENPSVVYVSPEEGAHVIIFPGEET